MPDTPLIVPVIEQLPRQRVKPDRNDWECGANRGPLNRGTGENLTAEAKPVQHHFHYSTRAILGAIGLANIVGWAIGLVLGGVNITGGLATSIIFSTLLFIYARLQAILVDRSGITGFNLWGTYGRIHWQERVEVETANIMGLPYLKLTGERAEIWLPLLLERPLQFFHLVRDYTPAAHPLNQTLHQVNDPRRSLTNTVENRTRRE